MLNGTLSLWDIRDTEAFCAKILEPQRPTLTEHDWQDALSYLIETAWELSRSYEPGGIAFSTWARTTLQKRVHDHTRQRLKRTRWVFSTHTYERERPVLISLDTELGRSLTDSTVDGPEHRLADLTRVLRTGPSTPPPGHPHHNPDMAQRAAA